MTPAEVADRVFPLTPAIRRDIDEGTARLIYQLGQPAEEEES